MTTSELEYLLEADQMIMVLTFTYVESDLEPEEPKKKWCVSDDSDFNEDDNNLEHEEEDLKNEEEIQKENLSQVNESVTK